MLQPSTIPGTGGCRAYWRRLGTAASWRWAPPLRDRCPVSWPVGVTLQGQIGKRGWGGERDAEADRVTRQHGLALGLRKQNGPNENGQYGRKTGYRTNLVGDHHVVRAATLRELHVGNRQG